MIAIIANPAAHNFSYDKLKWVVGKIRNNGINVDVFITKRQGDGTRIASLVDGGYEVVAAFGGDGIINEIINAPLKSSALAVLPAGTTNVLAIELFGRVDLEKAAEAVIRRKRKRVYSARINSRRFLLMAGFGFDAESVYAVNPTVKRFSGKLAYVLAGIEAYLKFDSECFDVVVDSKRYRVIWAIVSKIKNYAGRFKISKSAELYDRVFDLFLCECRDRRWILPYCNAALFGQFHFLNVPFIKHLIAERMVVEGSVKIQVDGDYYAEGNAVVEIDRSMDLIVP